MTSLRIAELPGLFDADGRWCGVINQAGEEQIAVPPGAAGSVAANAARQLVLAGGGGLAINAWPARPVKVLDAGASQTSRNSTEVLVTSAQFRDGLLYITHAAPISGGFVTGATAFCAVDGHFAFGPVTVTSNTTLTMQAPPGTANTVANTAGTQFLHFRGMDTSASWSGRLKSRYGAGMVRVGNISQHGANIFDVAARMPELLRVIDQEQPDIVIFEPGWGNSFNQGLSWANTLPQALENLRRVCAVAPTVLVASLPPPAPGWAGLTTEKLANFTRMNHYILSGDVQRDFPNAIPVDCTTPLLDFTRTDAGSIADVHIDDLHWTAKGAEILETQCYGPVMDRLVPKIPFGRMGRAHAWVNGNRQLYDGLFDNTGYLPVISGVTVTGGSVLDGTMVCTKAGGSAVTATFTKTQMPNGLFKQVVAYSGMGATTVMSLTVPGAAGALLKDRVLPGRTYRMVVRMAITGVTGTVRAVNVAAQAVLTGHAATGPLTIWAGRTQEGAVEGGQNGFVQVATEAARDYYGGEFTVPAGVTVASFEGVIAVRTGATGSGMSFETENITLQDVTP